MDEITARIIADAANAQRNCGAADIGQGCTRNANIEGTAFHVQAVFRHFAAAAQKIIVICRRAVAADDMDFAAAAKPGTDEVEKLNGLDVNGVLLICIVTAQQPVQFPDGLDIVMTVRVAIGGGYFFAGMGVV